MISVRFDSDKKFARQMNNLVKYSIGFIEGIDAGKHIFFISVGEKLKEIMSLFIDSMARQSPESLHHVYEWYQTGNPSERLFEINYTISNFGLSMNSTFSQSVSVRRGSTTPFYDKARMMEDGASVIIRPVNAEVLVFEDGGETVFTKGPVKVDQVGGPQTQGSFQNAFDTFVNTFLTQSVLQTIGISKSFGNMMTYSKNLQAGLHSGKAVGVSAGYKWVSNLGVGI